MLLEWRPVMLGLLLPGLFVAGALAASESFGGADEFGGEGFSSPDFDAAMELVGRFLRQGRQPVLARQPRAGASGDGLYVDVSTGIPSVTVVGGLSDVDAGYIRAYLKSKYGLSRVDPLRAEISSSSGPVPAARIEFRE